MMINYQAPLLYMHLYLKFTFCDIEFDSYFYKVIEMCHQDGLL